MQTLKDIGSNDWDQLSFDDKLDITINTMFVLGKINVEDKICFGEYGGEGKIELCCTEDDDKLALTEGWIKISSGADIEINLWRGNGQPYLVDEVFLWDEVYNYLEGLLEKE